MAASTIRVIAGRNNQQVSSLTGVNYGNAQTIYPHPGYDDTTLVNDISIIQLDRPLTIDGITTRLAYVENGTIPINYQGTVSGWGYTDTQQSTVQANLRKVTVPVVSDSICNGSPYHFGMSSPNQICAGDGNNHDACVGDSGGPLLRVLNTTTNDYVVFGIVSYGGPTTGCGGINRGVYTSTSYYLQSFIKTYAPNVQTNAYSSSSPLSPSVNSPTKTPMTSPHTSNGASSQITCVILLIICILFSSNYINSFME